MFRFYCLDCVGPLLHFVLGRGLHVGEGLLVVIFFGLGLFVLGVSIGYGLAFWEDFTREKQMRERFELQERERTKQNDSF